MDHAADADAARCCECFEPCRDIDAVTEDIATVDDDVAQVDADAEFEPAVGQDSRIAFGHPALDRAGAIDRIDDAGEFDQQPVAGRLDDAAAMGRDLWVEESLAMLLKRA